MKSKEHLGFRLIRLHRLFRGCLQHTFFMRSQKLWAFDGVLTALHLAKKEDFLFVNLLLVSVLNIGKQLRYSNLSLSKNSSLFLCLNLLFSSLNSWHWFIFGYKLFKSNFSHLQIVQKWKTLPNLKKKNAYLIVHSIIVGIIIFCLVPKIS